MWSVTHTGNWSAYPNFMRTRKQTVFYDFSSYD